MPKSFLAKALSWSFFFTMDYDNSNSALTGKPFPHLLNLVLQEPQTDEMDEAPLRARPTASEPSGSNIFLPALPVSPERPPSVLAPLETKAFIISFSCKLRLKLPIRKTQLDPTNDSPRPQIHKISSRLLEDVKVCLLKIVSFLLDKSLS